MCDKVVKHVRFTTCVCPGHVAYDCKDDIPILEFAGVYTLDQVLLVFCSTGMLVGGVTAFFLDNTIPGWLHITKM